MRGFAKSIVVVNVRVFDGLVSGLQAIGTGMLECWAASASDEAKSILISCQN